MPKQERKVTCPRCHRHIPEGKLAEHIREHKGKIPAYLRTLGTPERKTHEPAASFSIPSFKEFFRQLHSNEPVLSSLSEEQIYSKFKKSLSDADAEYHSINLEPTEDPEFIEIFIDEQRNLTLKYSPLLLRTLNEESIDALLLHEACHVVTVPTSLLRVPDTGNEMTYFIADYLTNYDEYLAHVEFVHRFRQDRRFEDLRQHQISLFKNFEIITSSTKTMLIAAKEKGLRIDQFKILQQLHGMVYDALFFYVAEDDSFSRWCKEHELGALNTFVGWIFEDFEHITRLGLSRDETQKKVMTSGTLSMSVNPIMTMILNQIEFADTAKSLHQELMERKQDADLVELWEKRRLLCEKQEADPMNVKKQK